MFDFDREATRAIERLAIEPLTLDALRAAIRESCKAAYEAGYGRALDDAPCEVCGETRDSMARLDAMAAAHYAADDAGIDAPECRACGDIAIASDARTREPQCFDHAPA